jgi:hypothetical protein
MTLSEVGGDGALAQARARAEVPGHDEVGQALGDLLGGGRAPDGDVE